MSVTKEYIGGLLDKYGDMVLRISYTYLKNRDDAEDVVQDVFLSVIDKCPEFKDSSHEKAWFVRAAINRCKNKLNLFWNKNKISADDVPEAPFTDRYSTDSGVLDAVTALPKKYKIPVYMYYYEGYSMDEIAKITDAASATVRSQLKRAREMLKNTLKEDYDFE